MGAGPRDADDRGGAWVAGQTVLIVAIGLSAFVGLTWTDALAPVAYAVGALLLASGAVLLGAGGVRLGSALTPYPAPRRGEVLRTGGIYRLARHPMYGGGILVALGWSAIFATPAGLALTVVLALFFELKSRHEEHRLERVYPGYGDYRRRVRRRFLPYLW